MTTDSSAASPGSIPKRWRAELSAYDRTEGGELGCINIEQTCKMFSNAGSFKCYGDHPGSYLMPITAPLGHSLSISIGGESWASVAGTSGRGDVLAGGHGELGAGAITSKNLWANRRSCCANKERERV